MGENLCLAVGKDQGQFVRKLLAVMKDSGAIFLLFFPMICELHRAPVGDVAVLAFAAHSIEHYRRANQADNAPMEGPEWPAPNVTLVGAEDPAPLAVFSRFRPHTVAHVQLV